MGKLSKHSHLSSARSGLFLCSGPDYDVPKVTCGIHWITIPACMGALLSFDNWILASNGTCGIHLLIIMSVQKNDGGVLQSQRIHRSAGGQIVLLLFVLSKYLVVTNQSSVFLLTKMCSHLGHTIVSCGLRSYI